METVLPFCQERTQQPSILEDVASRHHPESWAEPSSDRKPITALVLDYIIQGQDVEYNIDI